MKLFISLLLLMAISSFGAQPSYTAFRGTGGITIVSNPPSGTIVIDGSGVFTSGTNSTINIATNGVKVSGVATQVNFVIGTNIFLLATNINNIAHVQINSTAVGGGGGGVGPTNANQFGASLTLTIKDGALFTNTTTVGGQALPGSSGTARTNFARFQNVGESQALDIGGVPSAGTPVWLQVHDPSDQSVNYNMWLQPNGGHVIIGGNGVNMARLGIGTNVPGATLHVRPITSGQTYLRVDDTNGTPRVQFGVYAGASALASLWFGDVTPLPSNLALAGDGLTTYMAASNRIEFQINAVPKWSIATHWTASTDNTSDIGQSGSGRPRNIYAGTSIMANVSVGIGTNAPASALHINGAFPNIRIDDTQAGSRNWAILNGQEAPGTLSIRNSVTSGTLPSQVRLLIDQNGNVGGIVGTLGIGAATQAYMKGAPTNSVAVTNVSGLVHLAAAALLVIDSNQSHDWSVTNRVTAATTLIFTNTADGQTLTARILGEAAGGTDRVITMQPQLGNLIADQDDFSVALAASSAFTLTNGNAAEISWSVRRLNGTNVACKITRQFKF